MSSQTYIVHGEWWNWRTNSHNGSKTDFDEICEYGKLFHQIPSQTYIAHGEWLNWRTNWHNGSKTDFDEICE